MVTLQRHEVYHVILKEAATTADYARLWYLPGVQQADKAPSLPFGVSARRYVRLTSVRLSSFREPLILSLLGFPSQFELGS